MVDSINREEFETTRVALNILDFENHGKYLRLTNLFNKIQNTWSMPNYKPTISRNEISDLVGVSMKFLQENKLVEWSICEQILKEINP